MTYFKPANDVNTETKVKYESRLQNFQQKVVDTIDRMSKAGYYTAEIGYVTGESDLINPTILALRKAGYDAGYSKMYLTIHWK